MCGSSPAPSLSPNTSENGRPMPHMAAGTWLLRKQGSGLHWRFTCFKRPLLLAWGRGTFWKITSMGLLWCWTLNPPKGISSVIKKRARLPELPMRSFPEYPKFQIKVLSDITWGGELSTEVNRQGSDWEYNNKGTENYNHWKREQTKSIIEEMVAGVPEGPAGLQHQPQQQGFPRAAWGVTGWPQPQDGRHNSPTHPAIS